MQANPRSIGVPLILILAAVTLMFGLFLPVITLNELVFWTHTFSVYTGIISLWQEHQYFLSLVIFVFSICFPLLKLGILFLMWFTHLSQERRVLYLKWLSSLGKWSMLDVFVVAMTIVIAKISKFASAEPRMGIYFFCASIMMAIFVTMRIEKLMKRA